MASNDYYNEHPYSNRRQDAALPPIPPPSPGIPSHGQPHGAPHSDVSPVTSPFDDHSYGYPPYPNNQQGGSSTTLPSYYGGNQAPTPPPKPPVSTDPFADQNAIPLRTKIPGKTGTDTVISPTDAENAYIPEDGRRHKSRTDRSRKKKKKGRFQGPIAWVVWTMTAVQTVVFIIEIIRNASLTHSPIEIHPQFNPMIGPSPNVLINMGARYVPCMRNTHNITDSPVPIRLQCPNATTEDALCTLSQACGFGGVPNPDPRNPDINRRPEPNQWWRFILPIFLHAGLIHIGFNMLLQCTLGREMELEIGSLRFALVYFSSGIFGFVFGGNYAATGVASTGASGCLFGILALTLLDLLYTWKLRRSPIKDLAFILVDVVISFALGLLPGLDNFSHIGGFMMGLVLGICILHSPDALRKRIGQDEPPYHPVRTGEPRQKYSGSGRPGTREGQSGRHQGPAAGAQGALQTGDEDQQQGLKGWVRQPVGFFKGRKPLWWVWWLLRAGALVAVLVGFIVLLRNFYVYRVTCSWCKYLSCLPVNNWCNLGNLQFTNDTTPPPSRLMTRNDMFPPDLFH
ncbi:rhomboid-domain-containing protein [Aulographum hederae CBS 113979]|uniref:Rhomboid-type serine protease n=1 Tax=Aulographum hederae CBS 113979 TaxID=1176131 RepID=A0A6G1GR26_9PEZI|nr:rhomboid-domain-containing protein [Aulographum hederae CBS 113979]